MHQYWYKETFKVTGVDKVPNYSVLDVDRFHCTVKWKVYHMQVIYKQILSESKWLYFEYEWNQHPISVKYGAQKQIQSDNIQGLFT